jgi:hypothetical protein
VAVINTRKRAGNLRRSSASWSCSPKLINP